MVKKVPNPVDIHVGSRVRLRRMLIGMSQERLGELLGLTFQQVQKYEKGTNRIGASRLFQISQILGVPVQFFFDDIAEDAFHLLDNNSVGTLSEADSSPFVMEFVSSAEGLELNRCYARIDNPQLRKRILDLIRCLADTPKVAEDKSLAGFDGAVDGAADDVPAYDPVTIEKTA